MKNFKVVFLVLLVGTVFLPSINFAYAVPISSPITSGEIVHATEDQDLNGGLIVNAGGELIVDSGVTLNINGVVVNSGKITIDGTLNDDGIIVNSGVVHVRCGELTANVIGKVVLEGGCDEPNQIIEDLIISSDNPVEVKEGRVVEIIGTVVIKEDGVLVNQGTIENHGNIVLEGGRLTNIGGIINNFCSNFDDRGINGVGIIVEGTINEIPCSAPVADDDFYSVNEDDILTIDAPGVLDGDTDTDSPTLTVLLQTDSTDGSTQLNPDGSFTYIPNPDFFGIGDEGNEFVYEVLDGDGGKDVGIVTIDVLPVNDAPMADDDDVVVNEDDGITDITDIVLDGDTDVDESDILSIINADSTSSAIGQVIVGSLLYSPNGEFETLGIGETGIDIFDYTVSDGNGGTSTAKVTVTVKGQNDAPEAEIDSYSVNEDEKLVIDTLTGVLGNDFDIDGDAFTSIIDKTTDNGELTLSSNGSFTYTPNPDFNGDDSFTYHANDGLLDSDIVTVKITVIDVVEPDTTPPTIEGILPITVEATGPETPNVELGEVTAEDDVDPTPLLTNDAPDVFSLGETEVKWTATDASGNFVNEIQLVTLVDTTSPSIEAPNNVFKAIEGTETSLSDAELGTATAEDAVDSEPTITNDAPDVFPLGETEVKWTATDASGNFVSVIQLVTIEQVSMSLLEEKIEKTIELENLIDEATKKMTVDELKKAVKDLKKGTETKKWEDDGNNLDDKDGKKAFKEFEKGVKHILKVLKEGKESDEFIFNLATILLELVDIDEKIAENEFMNASGSSDPNKKCLDKAENEFDKAQKDEMKKKFDQAVKHYGKVWENSQKAVKKSGPGSDCL